MARRFIIALELVVGVLALAGGVALIANPRGTMLGFDVAMLHGIFKSFLVPGVILLALALLFFASALATWRRWLWDHALSTVAGAALVTWISVQVVIIGFHDWTQVVFFLLGVALLYMATEMWRLGEGPHLGLVEGNEHLDDTKHPHATSVDHRESPPWPRVRRPLRRRA